MCRCYIEAGREERERQSRIESRKASRESSSVKYDAWGNVVKHRGRARPGQRESLGAMTAGSDDEDMGNMSDSDVSSDSDGRDAGVSVAGRRRGKSPVSMVGRCKYNSFDPRIERRMVSNTVVKKGVDQNWLNSSFDSTLFPHPHHQGVTV